LFLGKESVKILLVNSPIWLDKPGVIAPVEPLGILYLAACLLRAGHHVAVADPTLDRYNKQKFISEIEAQHYDVIGFSCRTASYAGTLRIIDDLTELSYKPLLLLGGNHPTALPELTLNDIPECIVVRGEGEVTVVELIDLLAHKGWCPDLASINGISYIGNGEIVHTPPRELIANLDSLPLPARHLITMEKYSWKIGGKAAVNILSSRGCPFNCIYCFKRIFKNKVRYRSIENIVSEIQDVKERFGREGVYFVDDFFTADNERLELFLHLLAENNLDIKWRCLTRVDGFQDVKLLKRMKERGCDTIIFGAESGDPETLVKIRKGISLAQSRDTIIAAQKAGINLKVNFMLGFPWETYQSVYNTLRFAGSLPPVREYAFYFVTPFPGTEIWDQYCRDQKYPWEAFTEFNAFFKGKSISDEDYQNLLIYASLYIFRRHFLKELFRIRTIRNIIGSILKHGFRKALFSLTQGAAPFINEDNPFRAVQGLLFELRDRTDWPIRRSLLFFLDPYYLQRRIRKEKRWLKKNADSIGN
jgi:anaerobic magnesium-protoporphyrin IX monomethyl ester cyclase